MYNDITKNRRRSFFLVTVFCLILLLLGTAAGWYIGDMRSGLFLAGGISLFMTLLGYFQGDTVALAVAGAKRVSREHHEDLFRLLDNLAIAAGMTTPPLYIIEDPSPNAFAAGRDPKHAVIAVTTGLISLLERHELEGVLAHELSHIKNEDTRLMTLTVVLVGSIILLADILTRGMFYGSSDRKQAGPLLIVGLVLAIFSPLIAKLIQLAVSRQREYLADASGALLTRFPEGLADALEKIARIDQPLARANHATAHLFLANPFDPNVTHSKFESAFSTHPPIRERIARLRSMGASNVL